MDPVKPLLALLALLSLARAARPPGDAAEGLKLVEENRCQSCHAEKTMGDAKAAYLRKDHKVTSMEKLKAQVALCNSQLGLKLFPEDEEHIAAYLNATYYKFGSK